jgi:hypothetical protein
LLRDAAYDHDGPAGLGCVLVVAAMNRVDAIIFLITCVDLDRRAITGRFMLNLNIDKAEKK